MNAPTSAATADSVDPVATRSLDFIFGGLSVLIALTTLAFPVVAGYGTCLFQIFFLADSHFLHWSLPQHTRILTMQPDSPSLPF